MATRKPPGGEHKPFDPAVADKLLELLSTDNDFRDLFAKDPEAAVRKAGHDIPEGAAMACMSTVQVAPKEEIAQARALIKAFLTSAAAYNNPHCFEAGRIVSTLESK
ncbi:NHLP-related RiPP peptide [Lysobacter capsici]|uniref:NHLP-related RiPP peptide n=1 Tax=Lysobacter capsici TaxID=435897 RepID=UPI001BFFF7B4|nr:NHLP-related RiPP peptide [Lysobacter capsici]MBW8807376.1 NHLP-related RiPP peptide [Lysobacter sp.]QWF17560.1 NHLP-related RiPP peptide [Lysobacter capsici]